MPQNSLNKINFSAQLHRLRGIWDELSHSQKSLFITCGIMFCNLVLSMTLQIEEKAMPQRPPEEIFVELSLEKEDVIIEEEENKKKDKKQDVVFVDTQIQTHQAFDENRDTTKDFKELEDEILEEELQKKELRTEDFLVEKNSENIETLLNKSKEVLNGSKDILAQTGNKKKSFSGDANNSRTTVSFDLEGRKAVDIRTPAYTCEIGGIMVVDIVVSKSGLVTNAKINKDASSNQDVAWRKMQSSMQERQYLFPQKASKNKKEQ